MSISITITLRLLDFAIKTGHTMSPFMRSFQRELGCTCLLHLKHPPPTPHPTQCLDSPTLQSSALNEPPICESPLPRAAPSVHYMGDSNEEGDNDDDVNLTLPPPIALCPLPPLLPSHSSGAPPLPRIRETATSRNLNEIGSLLRTFVEKYHRCEDDTREVPGFAMTGVEPSLKRRKITIELV